MSWQKQVKQIAVAVAVLSGIFMALSVGIGDAVQIVLDPNDPNNPIDAEDLATFGGNIDFTDRIAVLGVFTTILGTAGLGLIRRSASNPPFVNTLITFMPIIVGLVAFSAFGSEVFSLIQGDRVWADYSDATNSYILFLAGSMVAGFVTLLERN